MAQISAFYSESGKTVVAVIRDGNLQFANASTEAMESYTAANIANYAFATTEVGSTGEYLLTWPSWLAVGTYTIQFCVIDTALTESDVLSRFAVANRYYDGANLLPDWVTKLAMSASPVSGSLEAAAQSLLTAAGTLTAAERTAFADSLLDDQAVDGVTLRNVVKIIAAVLAGKLTGAGTTSPTFYGLDGETERVTATCDEDGNRTDVTYSVD